LVCCINVFV